ncbi:glycosyltransferase family 2 protein [Rhodoferax koreense]|nr:glycosyltransferase family 2 protein [Rhodoferax koreense]
MTTAAVTEHARVAVLMCTYNGEKYLSQQLESMRAQTHSNWTLHVSDDGSKDGSLAILRAFAASFDDNRVQVYEGPRQGFSRNFFSLIARAEIQADCYAFCDQDDEWDTGKLARATQALGGLQAGLPGLYGTSSELIRASGDRIGRSRIFHKKPGFANALVQNMTTGNTMVLNHAAVDLMRRAGTDVEVSAHDWWAYLLITGNGGTMIYDPYPTIRYRQHGSNLYGENISLRAKWARVSKLFKGDFKTWNALNVAALRKCAHMLTQQSLHRLDMFDRARRASLLSRPVYLLRSGVYRQTWDGQLALIIATFAKRI